MIAAIASADKFIEITDNGEIVTSPMPADETVVEVRLTDGTVTRAWFSKDIMDVGDWDFVAVAPGQDEPSENADSIANYVAAWRDLS
jgi:hypothetical protein